ncbi:MAG: hypothetical protein ACRD3W_18630, partial [Terriglobales bacterium]
PLRPASSMVEFSGHLTVKGSPGGMANLGRNRGPKGVSVRPPRTTLSIDFAGWNGYKQAKSLFPELLLDTVRS